MKNELAIWVAAFGLVLSMAANANRGSVTDNTGGPSGAAPAPQTLRPSEQIRIERANNNTAKDAVATAKDRGHAEACAKRGSKPVDCK